MQLKTLKQPGATPAYLLILHPEENLREEITRDFAKIMGWDLYIARQRLRLLAPQILRKAKNRETAEKLFIELSALGLKITLASQEELAKIPPPLEVKGAKLGPDSLSFIPYEGSPLEFPFSQGVLVVRGAIDKAVLVDAPKGFLRKTVKQVMVNEARRKPVDPLYCALADIYSLAGPQGARIWFYKFNFELLGSRREASPFLNFNHLLELLGAQFQGLTQDDNFKWLPKDAQIRRERKIFSDLGLGTIKEQVAMDNLEQFNQYSRLRFAVQLSQRG